MASIRQKGVIWYVRFRDAKGKEHEVKAGPLRETAVILANHFEGQVRLEKHGVLSVDATLWSKADTYPLDGLLNRWLSFLHCSGVSKTTCSQKAHQVTQIMLVIDATKISDLLPDAVTAAIQLIGENPPSRRRSILSIKTLYNYAITCKQFTAWVGEQLKSDKHILSDMAPPQLPASKSWIDRRKFK